MLEPDALKGASPVLRRGRGRNPPDLFDRHGRIMPLFTVIPCFPCFPWLNFHLGLGKEFRFLTIIVSFNLLLSIQKFTYFDT